MKTPYYYLFSLCCWVWERGGEEREKTRVRPGFKDPPIKKEKKKWVLDNFNIFLSLWKEDICQLKLVNGVFVHKLSLKLRFLVMWRFYATGLTFSIWYQPHFIVIWHFGPLSSENNNFFNNKRKTINCWVLIIWENITFTRTFIFYFFIFLIWRRGRWNWIITRKNSGFYY